MKTALVNQLITAVRADDWPAVKVLVPKIATARIGKTRATLTAEFHTLWVEKGHRIREQVLDDGLMVGALRMLLPAYEGSGLKLFRGENAGRWKEQLCGFAWTPNEDTARMFARGLNSIYVGGVLLSTEAPAEAIIAGPNKHSRLRQT